MTQKTKLIVVLGPTAVGKTALGIQLAQAYNGEIISGDSQQVYHKLDIGTAKATSEEQAAAVHHLIDVRDVSETYSAFDFVQEARAAIADIAGRGKLPIIVGGTGLYLQSLLEGFHLGGDVDQEALLPYRAELEKLSDQDLFDQIASAGITISQMNRRRAIRALELQKFGGKMENQEQPYDVLMIGLSDDREKLYDRINKRVDVMMAQGLLDEVSWLHQHYPEAQASRGIGYKEFFPYLEGQEELDTAVERVKQQSRRFAKRQLTWFRNRMKVDFHMVSEPDCMEQIRKEVEAFLHD